MIKKILGDISQDDFISIIKFFKGKAHNRITIYAIGAGAAIAGTSIWLELLSALLDKEFDLPIVDSLSKWLGSGIIVVSLIYNYLMNRGVLNEMVAKVAEKKLLHDIDVFNKMDLSAKYFLESKQNIEKFRLVSGVDWKYFEDIKFFLESVENNFFDKNVQNSSDLFCENLNNFSVKMTSIELTTKSALVRGFPIPGSKPNTYLNYIITGEASQNEVKEIIEKINNSYSNFRISVRDYLFI